MAAKTWLLAALAACILSCNVALGAQESVGSARLAVVGEGCLTVWHVCRPVRAVRLHA